MIPEGLQKASALGSSARWLLLDCQVYVRDASPGLTESPRGFENPKNIMLIITKMHILLSPLPREIQVKKKIILKNYITN